MVHRFVFVNIVFESVSRGVYYILFKNVSFGYMNIFFVAKTIGSVLKYMIYGMLFAVLSTSSFGGELGLFSLQV